VVVILVWTSTGLLLALAALRRVAVVGPPLHLVHVGA